jgi:hypothetical protein
MRQGRQDGRLWAELPVTERLAEYSVRDDSGCLVWQRSTNAYGYGHLRVRGRLRVAHRVVWELAHGPIPAGMLVLHSCDNPSCIAIEHLHVGTAKDNAQEKIARRRFDNGRAPMLPDETALAIRRDWFRGGVRQRELAERYGTTVPVVANLVIGHTYKHLL